MSSGMLSPKSSPRAHYRHGPWSQGLRAAGGAGSAIWQTVVLTTPAAGTLQERGAGRRAAPPPIS